MKYINNYLEYLKVVKKHSNYTITSYKVDLMELYDFNTDYINIDEDGIKDFLEYLYSKGLNRNSISRKICSIRGLFQYLHKEAIIKDNLFKEVISPKKNNSLPKYIKTNDIEKMFLCFDKEDCFNERNALILEMLYATGVRIGELINIKVSDINLYDRTIKIMGKGRKERIVIYGSFCEDALKKYLNDGRKILSKDKNCDYLFLNKNGGKLSARFIRKIIDDVVRKCEIDYHISPHTLRHTFATDLLNNGADLMTVKELLGHSSINTTGIYTHVSNEQLKKVYNFAHPRSKE